MTKQPELSEEGKKIMAKVDAMVDAQQKKEGGVRVANTPPFKLKDKPGREAVAIDMKKQFGFLPETIVIEKVQGHNNTIFLRAVLPEKIVKKVEEEEKLASKAKIGKK